MWYLAITLGAAAAIFGGLWKYWQVAAWKAGLITLGIVGLAWIIIGLGLAILFIAAIRNLH